MDSLVEDKRTLQAALEQHKGRLEQLREQYKACMVRFCDISAPRELDRVIA